MPSELWAGDLIKRKILSITRSTWIWFGEKSGTFDGTKQRYVQTLWYRNTLNLVLFSAVSILLSPFHFWIKFWQLNFYQKCPNFLGREKIDINRVNLTPWRTHSVLKKMSLSGAKDEHFFAFIAHANEGEEIRIFDLFYIADVNLR